MIRFFAEHKNAANILMMAIVLLGLATLPSLNKETFPEIKNRNVQVSVAYPGASPLEIEESLCQPLEDATDGISFLEEQRCVAKDNLGVFTAKMQEAGDRSTFLDDIKAAVDGINTFPDDVEEPVIKQLGRTQPVVSIAVASNLHPTELKQLAEYYRTELLKLPVIPMVKVSGFSTHEFRVQVNAEAMGQYSLSIDNIANLIRQHAIDLPVGSLESTDQRYQLRFKNARRTAEELEDLVILDDSKGGLIRLGDIATIEDRFVDDAVQNEINGLPAAILQVSKNSTDDTLKIFAAVKEFVDQENRRLPSGTELIITQDSASIVSDRLSLLLKNGWQGLLLATFALFLFFNWRYTFWVAIGLPVCFIGGLVIMNLLGVTINMISMVALLMAIGILMDDAIVISESISAEYKKTTNPLESVLLGVNKVRRGVLSSFITSSLLFGSLLFLAGDMGQVMRVLPMVLLAVLSISLIEAFLILPRHLNHSLEQHKHLKPANWRIQFEAGFDRLREWVGKIADLAVASRYLVVGCALGLLVFTISMLPAGVLKFKFFPDLEGNILEARVLMAQGTTLEKTKQTVDELLTALQKALAELPKESQGELVKNIQIAFSENKDADESGSHLATITLDLLNAESRTNSINALRNAWSAQMPAEPNAISILFKEPSVGPAGKAISIRLSGKDLDELSRASWRLQSWLNGYDGVFNVFDDLRPGKPQYSITLQPGALSSGVDARSLSTQLRAAYQGIKVDDIYLGNEAYEINIRLSEQPERALEDFEKLMIFSQQGLSMPLSAIANIETSREYSTITRIDHQRTVTISGDIDNNLANTNEVINDTKNRFLPQLLSEYPSVSFSLEGEVKNSGETNSSIMVGFLLGIVGVYFLLSLQFQNYVEPLIVMMNIPLALIGVIWGHLLMGLDLTMPSMIGFVSLAGVVVNDSILLVEFVKLRSKEGLSLHAAASQAVRDRFRAIFLTSITTVAGMLPLLSETSLQAQVLVPLVASVVFGMMASTILLLLVLPSTYSILEDYRAARGR